ncbi:hypothetical protein [Streptomyces sp. NPDC058045]|uniref:hypothetical protein n=1 Tax=Streptomyces sp. NPDC058045 TaxID=3346311 RepID=UPI0036EB2680
MSLVDPASRWWNRDANRRGAAYTCWTVAVLLALVGMWSTMAAGVSPLPMWFGVASAVLPIPLLLGGMFLIGFASAHRDGLDPRYLVVPLASYFIANGTGALLGGYQSEHGLEGGHAVFAVFLAGGIAAIAVSGLLRRHSRARASLRELVGRSGVVTTGVVTRARGSLLNHRPATRVTVKFTDTRGRDRWATDTIAGTVHTGEKLRVHYAPDAPDATDATDRKATAVLSRRRR